MTKYQPLRAYLDGQQAGRVRLGFDEIERLLGFKLPRSARDYRPWWSNNTGGNVAIRAWRDAGWRTAEVDMAGEQVTFVRENGKREVAPGPGIAEAGASYVAPPLSGPITLNPDVLSHSAKRLIEETARESDISTSEAIASLLDWVVLERRRKMIQEFRAQTGPVSGDSVQMIRELRDSR